MTKVNPSGISYVLENEARQQLGVHVGTDNIYRVDARLPEPDGWFSGARWELTEEQFRAFLEVLADNLPERME